MKVETIGKEIIKPSTTTPNDLRTLQLSIHDHMISPVYTTAFLFYTKDDLTSQDHISHKLKTSLSETLTRFHPFAGRINGVTVDCNDEGAVFVEARVDDCTLSGFIRSPDFESLKLLLPLDPDATPTWPLLLVKSTYFQCGGMAIAICISHKLADATSLSIFVRSWTATARGESDLETIPEFAGAKLYPPANEAFKIPVDVQADKGTPVTKRFVFVASKIEELRVKAASDAVPRPTRVQSVTSLIWRCVAASSDTSREKVLVQPANLRPKIPSLSSGNVIGNLFFSTVTFNGKGEVQISETVKELQERAKEFALLVQGEEGSIGTKLVGQIMGYASKLSSKNQDIHPVTSWCKLQFYDADFGWGSPVWVAGNVVLSSHNKTVLIDSKDGQGIEAWVTLHQEAMLLFEQNPDLLAFASPNA
ncbi:unnamed protein product [Eruca vesicaria subsp. sativa]|uniref:Uncharacterized protein n=1 Tax=Eruca vesicaria subsp. sativa TaxID=29727 RepID=A0ABC8KAP2_ERUVS|nr:unnamed protein product [Eruca vesicaria subsp. sativa]